MSRIELPIKLAMVDMFLLNEEFVPIIIIFSFFMIRVLIVSKKHYRQQKKIRAFTIVIFVSLFDS